MNNMLLFCESDVALRCPEVEMAIFQGLFDLFTGTYESADSEGDDVLTELLIATAMLTDSAALGRVSAERWKDFQRCVMYIYVTDLCYLNRLMRCRNNRS